MTLTNEDVAVFRKAIKEEIADAVKEQIEPMIDARLEEKLTPLCKEQELVRETMRKLLTTQIDLVGKIDDLETRVGFIMHHLNLSQTSRDLRQTLKALD